MIAGVACLGFTPLYWILWRYGALNLLAVALLFFAWTVARELFRLPPSAELRC
jgi:hypothetical protein